MAKKTQITFENNFALFEEAIAAAPSKVMATIGKQVAKELRPKLDKQTGRLRKSVGYWYRKKDHDLQIGYYNNYFEKKRWAAFYKEAVIEQNNPLIDVVRANAGYINKLIGEAMQALGVKDKAWIESMIGSDQDEQGE